MQDIETILSIDPGINYCGLSVLTLESGVLNIKETKLIKNVRKFTEDEKTIEKKYDNKTVKVLTILNEVRSIIDKYEIEEIVIEAPFYNALTPMAYGSLLEVIFSIKYTIAVPNSYTLKLIEPLLVKKFFANNSLASKQIIKEFLVNKISLGSIVLNKSIEELSEHEIDSIAIGFTYLWDKINLGE